MDNSNFLLEISIPEEWHPTNDWDSHRPLLWMAMKDATGRIIELGCGYGSTPLIRKMVNEDTNQKYRGFMSLETNKEYADLFEVTGHVPDYFCAEDFMSCGLLFIDCAPGEIRKDLIERFADGAQIIVVHDTEPGAEYVYHMTEALNKFKYRCDLKIEGAPQTTAVSNVVDVSTWKGIYNDKYQIV